MQNENYLQNPVVGEHCRWNLWDPGCWDPFELCPRRGDWKIQYIHDQKIRYVIVPPFFQDQNIQFIHPPCCHVKNIQYIFFDLYWCIHQLSDQLADCFSNNFHAFCLFVRSWSFHLIPTHSLISSLLLIQISINTNSLIRKFNTCLIPYLHSGFTTTICYWLPNYVIWFEID